MTLSLQARARRWQLFGTTGLVLGATWPLFALANHQASLLPMCRTVRRLGSNALLTLNGIRVDTRFETDIDPEQPYVVCPNHASYLDMSVIMKALPMPGVFLSKTDVADMPLVGVFSRGLDIPVSRERPRLARQALARAVQTLAAGTSVVIFPEGAFAGPPETLSHFFNGAFKLAIRAQVPILPVTLFDTWNRLPDSPAGFSAGRVTVTVHAPIATRGLQLRRAWGTTEDVYALKARTRAVIDACLQAQREAPGYRNHWTGSTLGVHGIPEYRRLTPYLSAVLAGRAR